MGAPPHSKAISGRINPEGLSNLYLSDHLETSISDVRPEFLDRRNPKSGSNHYTYFHPYLIDILTIPKDRPIKEVYVKKALKLLDIALKDFR